MRRTSATGSGPGMGAEASSPRAPRGSTLRSLNLRPGPGTSDPSPRVSLLHVHPSISAASLPCSLRRLGCLSAMFPPPPRPPPRHTPSTAPAIIASAQRALRTARARPTAALARRPRKRLMPGLPLHPQRPSHGEDAGARLTSSTRRRDPASVPVMHPHSPGSAGWRRVRVPPETKGSIGGSTVNGALARGGSFQNLYATGVPTSAPHRAGTVRWEAHRCDDRRCAPIRRTRATYRPSVA